ncbi:unnamed protein product [Coregonus sp. 'balchen']|nr:unnamed protein product [Coregonus sp. 'balchen']
MNIVASTTCDVSLCDQRKKLNMSLTSFLPAPTQLSQDQLESEERARAQRSHSTALVSSRREPPPYGYRKSWVPRSLEDFGDGGAFPEIHVAQFPLEMGRKKKTSNALAVQVIFSKYTDLLPKEVLNDDAPELQKPDEEAVKELTEKTRDALMKQVSQKIAAAMPGVAFNSGAKQRVIRMVEMQKDPMEPPRFKINKKIPRGPPSPPAPMTVKEQQEWKIPPCISNWKNAKGYTIPLDKRLAADGRGLQTVHINENFAKLAEALYIADRKAREAVEMRAQVEKKMAQKEKEKKEEKLRELAQMARDRRAGIKGHGGDKAGEDGEARERDEIRRSCRETRTEISGMDSGFAGGEDEMYNVYDQPFRRGADMAQNIYRPTKSSDKDMYGDDLDTLMQTNKFVPDREFSGTDHGPRRDGPVQFEEDPFGLDKFLEEAKQHGGSKRPSTSRGSKDYDHDKKRRKE